MKQKLLLTAIAVMTFMISKAQKPVDGEYIVLLKETYSRPLVKSQIRHNDPATKMALNKPERDRIVIKTKSVLNRRNIKPSSVISEFTDVVVGFSAKLTKEEKIALENDPAVEAVYQDYYVELDPKETISSRPGVSLPRNNVKKGENEKYVDLVKSGPNDLSGHITNINNNFQDPQVTPCGITKAGGSVSGAAKTTRIWVLDTGIDLDHPDLNVVTALAKSFVPGVISADDGHGHGTHVAGIAAAKNNSFGVIGVSAGAKLVPVKVMPDIGRGCQMSWIVQALDYVGQNDMVGDVVNLSIQYYGPDGLGISNCENSNLGLRNAMRNLGEAGTYIVIASGNNSTPAIRCQPGCIDGTRIYTVGAINCNAQNSCWEFSNWNAVDKSYPVDWVAVGGSVFSTHKNGGYETIDGTSMAAPHVAGIIHARGGPPVHSASKVCNGRSYKIARRN